MTNSTLVLGRLGEKTARNYLLQHGFTIVNRNARSSIGEIDIIAQKGSVIYIFEVKTRKSDRYGLPLEAVNKTKAKRLQILGEKYCLQNGLKKHKLSLGIISIIISDEGDNFIRIYDYFI